MCTLSLSSHLTLRKIAVTFLSPFFRDLVYPMWFDISLYTGFYYISIFFSWLFLSFSCSYHKRLCTTSPTQILAVTLSWQHVKIETARLLSMKNNDRIGRLSNFHCPTFLIRTTLTFLISSSLYWLLFVCIYNSLLSCVSAIHFVWHLTTFLFKNITFSRWILERNLRINNTKNSPLLSQFHPFLNTVHSSLFLLSLHFYRIILYFYKWQGCPALPGRVPQSQSQIILNPFLFYWQERNSAQTVFLPQELLFCKTDSSEDTSRSQQS